MNFREATRDDLPSLLALEQAVVSAERPFNAYIKADGAIYYNINQLIDSENACLLVLEVDGKIIATGYGQIRNSKPSLVHQQHCYLGFMYVLPEYRGQGLNQQLIEQLVEWSKGKGVHHFYLDVYAENEAAIKAYEKAGFKASLLEMTFSPTH